jgi:hypothetical protein
MLALSEQAWKPMASSSENLCLKTSNAPITAITAARLTPKLIPVAHRTNWIRWSFSVVKVEGTMWQN